MTELPPDHIRKVPEETWDRLKRHGREHIDHGTPAAPEPISDSDSESSDQ